MKFQVTIAGTIYKYVFIPYSKKINSELNREHKTIGQIYHFLYILIQTHVNDSKGSKAVELSDILPVIVKDPILVRIAKEGEKKQIYKNAPVVMTCTLDTKVNKLHGKLETIGDLPSFNAILTATSWEILSSNANAQVDNSRLRKAVMNTLNPKKETSTTNNTNYQNQPTNPPSTEEKTQPTEPESIPDNSTYSQQEESQSYNTGRQTDNFDNEQDLDPEPYPTDTDLNNDPGQDDAEAKLEDAQNDLFNFLGELDMDDK